MIDALALLTGTGLLWGLWRHYTFQPTAVDKKAVAKKIKQSLQDGDYEKVDIGL